MAERISIVVDHRERCSGIAALLRAHDVDVQEEQLPVGDYIISERIAVERKRATDFLDSLVGQRLFDQVGRLADAYPRPILVIEGDGLFSRNIHERAIYGALSSIVVDYNFSVFTAADVTETARLLYSMAYREQVKTSRSIALRGSTPTQSLPEQQRYVIEGLPFVSAVSSQKLLDYFGSVRRVINATIEELQEIEGIGEKKAREIKRIIESRWCDDEEQGEEPDE
ncbi:MAG: ERCC4 domain-containing protein [Thermoplasmatota archaeon]